MPRVVLSGQARHEKRAQGTKVEAYFWTQSGRIPVRRALLPVIMHVTGKSARPTAKNTIAACLSSEAKVETGQIVASAI